ncbi:CDP-glycerol glycerophosphotransferase family protein [Defluviitalea phaphyphila]|uniref:CDP-glycerol glycerophosphotransferase family protein n=1 Tax=Defluviitalea phaphyphila TaxID=1473580 RepID=UPI00073033B8|nr:CDP-glycerol glycerophosphotransferase family protein [Defluviitalea phaphyphila]
MNDTKSLEKQLKDNIYTLINMEKFNEAHELIQQYELINKNDIEIYYIKGIMHMIEENIEDAKRFLHRGIEIFDGDFELLYNFGYVYKIKQNYNLSLYFYLKAIQKTNSQELIKQIKNQIKKLQILINKEETEIQKRRFKKVEYGEKHLTSNGKKRITLVYTNLSGSNTVALYKFANKEIREKYNIELVLGDLSGDYLNNIINSDMVIFTEGNYPFSSRPKDKLPIVLDLWHGFPIKAMGYADKGEKYKHLIKKMWDNVDYITSYSPLFNDVMNRCTAIDISKFIITGAQRNDLLLQTDGRKNIENLFEEKFYDNKFVFYMPTYRYTPRGDRKEGNRSWRNIFGFKEFSIDKFIDFLQKNNIIFFIKLHPAEEHKFIKELPQNENVKIITNKNLYEKGMDLYEVLNAANLLITDYSSVYFDTLLLNMPVIFTPVDLQEYQKSRGFILEPYEDWTPGPKCITQENLENEIIKLLSDANYYKNERIKILKKTHKYLDGNSCDRTWKFIEEVLKNRF